MSFEAVSYVGKLDFRGDQCAKLVALAIAESAHRETQECWPGTVVLSDFAECAVRTVRRKTAMLQGLGVVSVVGKKFRNANLYRVNIGAAPDWEAWERLMAADPEGGATGVTESPVAEAPNGVTGGTTDETTGAIGVRENGLSGATAVTATGDTAVALHEPIGTQRTEPEKNQAPPGALDLLPSALPGSLSKATWAEFRRMRARIRVPLTAEGERLLLLKLEQLVAEGQDASGVVEESIMHGWKGLFALKRSQQRRAAEQNPAPAPAAVPDAGLTQRFGSVRAALAERLPEEDVEAWLNRTYAVAVSAELIVLGGVSNTFFRARMRQEFGADLRAAVLQAFPELAAGAKIKLLLEGEPWPQPAP